MDPLFWELHRDLTHEAPGTHGDTLRALALTGLSGPLRVVDAGSGPGAASLVLLEALPEAQVTAVDLHAPFVEDARRRVRAAGLAERFAAAVGDMTELPAERTSLDLIWCEGAIYVPGIETALRTWRPLLAPGGRVVFSDAVWLAEDPHPDAVALWEAYPGMTDRAGVARRAEDAGFRLLDGFVLGEAAWDAYYGPLGERLARLEAEHGAGHPVLAAARREIAVRRAHGSDYGYAFFVAEAK